ncbi:endonuclease/exonuclease/phosphatase family protein [Streptomyces sp. NBC_01387]|uniref:endonuclease/exonuclease/phosphatase family protein n=1 Tax=unclassified Streptomyces TaxID=2593676 RepID=UPI0020250961|nr:MULTISPECIES: endonuclease/exonuclease/phosphatase family protein [unclassified Streptomyces]MCX4549425.1 endonuclease/exonuclease/phosphatase family protein [Streptomyces sp. NBC_01500]WSC20960.1 endonuclease/exonuclease/phosphatase family protein [Streptomyces sp. NBC_01766]WSV54967.1 endonuclease/exonuclease/phosphatase family protein [Streptomyces sp. NBC_01014]
MKLTRRVAEVLLVTGVLAATVAPPAQAHGRDVPLRVASYNIHAGAGMDNVFDLDRQEAAMRALHADVIGLEEVDVRWGARSEWRDLAGELAKRLGMHVSFAPIYSIDGREFGVAVLSRYRILHAENHEITRLSTQDPNPVPAPAPGFGEVELRVKGVPLHVYVTHLDYRADPSVRVTQVAETRRIMAQQHGRKILLGDFNATPDAPELAPLWRELRDVEPGAPTFPAQNPVQRIDYVAVSPGVGVRGAQVADTLASDHRPIVAELSLKR